MGGMNYRITGKRVLCRKVETEETMPDFPSIVIPDAIRDGMSADQAEIVAVGTKCESDLKPGDWVILRKWSRDEAPPQLGEGLFLVPEDAVLARLNL